MYRKFLIDGIVISMNLNADISIVEKWTTDTMKIIGAEFLDLNDILGEDRPNDFTDTADYFFHKINRMDIRDFIVNNYVSECMRFKS